MVNPSSRHQALPLVQGQVGVVRDTLTVQYNTRTVVRSEHSIAYNILQRVSAQRSFGWMNALTMIHDEVEFRWAYLARTSSGVKLMWKYFAPYAPTVFPHPPPPPKVIIDTDAVIPHLALPFIIGDRAAVTEQDSIEEIAHCVEAILRYPQGYRLENIEFGLPDQLFKEGGAELEDFREAVRRWEPRANALYEESPDQFDELISMVRVIVRGRMDA